MVYIYMLYMYRIDNRMERLKDQYGPLVTSTGNTGKSPGGTRESLAVNWHVLGPTCAGEQRLRLVLWVPHRFSLSLKRFSYTYRISFFLSEVIVSCVIWNVLLLFIENS